MSLFDPTVEKIAPLPRRDGWVRVTLSDGQRFDITESRCVSLSLRVSRSLDAAQRGALQQAQEVDAVLRRAGRYLAARAHSREQLRRKLARHAEAVHIEPALDELERAGLLDDADFAVRTFESETARGPGRAAIARAKLEQAGVEPGLIEDADARASTDPAGEARALVEQKLKPSDRSHPRKAAARLYRLLAARGFDEETARSAIEAVLGTMEDDHADPTDAPSDEPPDLPDEPWPD